MQQRILPKYKGIGTSLILLLLAMAGVGAPKKPTSTKPRLEFVYVATSDSIHQFRLGANATLIPLSPPEAPLQTSPNFRGGPVSLTVNKAGQFVYVPASEINVLWNAKSLQMGKPSVSHVTLRTLIYQYRVGTDGSLVPLSPAKISAGDSMTFMNQKLSLQIAGGGHFAYLADFGVNREGDKPVPLGAMIGRYQIKEDGTLQALAPYLIPEKYGNPILKIDPTGRYAYIYDNATQIKENTVAATIFQCRITSDGSLLPLQPAIIHLGRVAVRDLVFRPDGQSAYAIVSKWNTKNDDVRHALQFQVQSDGVLSPMETAEVNMDSYDDTLSIAPDGKNAYASGGPSSSMAVQFQFNSAGVLSQPVRSTYFPKTSGVSFVLDPTGRFAYVVGYDNGFIFQYRIGPNGTLSELTPKYIDTGTLPENLYLDPLSRFLCFGNLHGADLSLYRINNGVLFPAKPEILKTETAPITVAFVLR